jgi:hypothetical protein
MVFDDFSRALATNIGRRDAMRLLSRALFGGAIAILLPRPVRAGGPPVPPGDDCTGDNCLNGKTGDVCGRTALETLCCPEGVNPCGARQCCSGGKPVCIGGNQCCDAGTTAICSGFCHTTDADQQCGTSCKDCRTSHQVCSNHGAADANASCVCPEGTVPTNCGGGYPPTCCPPGGTCPKGACNNTV